MSAPVIKGYRVAGGAVITVLRGERTHQYRIGLRRFHALKHSLNHCNGWHGRNSIDITWRARPTDWKRSR